MDRTGRRRYAPPSSSLQHGGDAIDPRGIASLLLISVLVVRPHLSGTTYPFTQGLLAVPVLIALGLVLLKQVRMPSGGEAFLIPVGLAWVLWTWALLTLTWTTDAGQGARVLMSLTLNIAAFTLAFYLLYAEKGLGRGAGLLVAVVSLPVLGRALYQRFLGFDLLAQELARMAGSGQDVADLTLILSGNRVFAGFLNANMLAGFLAILLPLTLDLALGSGKRASFYLLSCLAAAQAGVLVLTGSLGGSLAAAAACLVVLLARRGIAGRRLLPLAVGAAGIVVLVIGIRGMDFLLGPESSLLQRGGYMEAGLRMAWVHPLAGWGAGAARGALMAYVSEGYRAVTDPHNFLILAWIEYGLPGVLLLGSVLFTAVPAVRRATGGRSVGRLPRGFVGLAAAAAAFWLHSLVDMDFSVPETALFGWCALGALLGWSAWLSRAEEGSGEVRPPAGPARLLGSLALLMVLPCLVFLQAESTAFRARRAFEEGQYGISADLYAAARRILPFSGRLVLEEGRARLAAGQEQEALRLFDRAGTLLEASPYPSWEKARVAQAQGRWRESVDLLERALEHFPTSPRIRIDLALAYLNLGQTDRGRELLQEARRYAGFDPRAAGLVDKVLGRPDP